MSNLSVVVPNVVAASNLISSSVPENDYPAWVAGTTYAKDAFVISPATHRVYQSMQAGNSGKDPTDVKNRSGSTVYWLDIGPTNRWAMFDSEVSTQTVVASPLTVVLTPGLFTDVYLAGLEANEVTVTVRDAPGGVEIFRYTAPLEGSQPADYDEYFWDPFEPLTDILIGGVEQYSSAEVTITLTSPGVIKCGMLLTGSRREIGKSLYGAKVKPRSYSYIKTNDFGVTSIVRRKATTDLSLTASVDLDDADRVVKIIQDLLDVVALWIGTDLPKYGSLRVLGLGSGEVTYPNPNQCQLSLDVMGVISTSSQ